MENRRQRNLTQYQKPRGLRGRLTLRRMNVSHSDLTDWGLAHISVDSRSTVLDVGCGGGRTLGKLAIMAAQGKVYGVDFSEESVAASKRTNARAIKKGLVEVRHGSVSQLPFPDNMFDLVTAVETHFWWPNLDGDVREVFRVVKPGGTFVVIAEVYKGANTAMSRKCEEQAPQTGMIILDIDGHREMLAKAGFRDVKVTVDPERGWICATGNK
jgi:ubiquinone/menaquinone biosynthesis C-methylase UbiE